MTTLNHNSISVKNLTKKFGDFIAVNDISFDVRKGEIFGFLGANGAGKTTAMRMLCGLSKPSSGSAMVAGFDIEKNPEAVKRSIGYMSQKFSLYQDLTVDRNIQLFATIYGMSKRDIAEKSELLYQNLEMKHLRNALVRDLPVGWKQKLAFAVSTIHSPRVVFLDEPTGGVDPLARRKFWELIYKTSDAGITVFVTTHYLDEAEYCNRVSIMVDGAIKALDTPSALKNQYGAQTMDEVFRLIASTATRSE